MKLDFLYQQEKFTFHFSLSKSFSHIFFRVSFDSFDFEVILFVVVVAVVVVYFILSRLLYLAFSVN